MRTRPASDSVIAALPALVRAAVAMGLLAGCASTTAATMVIEGQVDLGPLCPVEQAGSPCPLPIDAFAGVEVVATSGDDDARAPVAADGSFTLTLAEGSWQVTSTAGMSCAAVTVTAPGRVVVTCDTGIR